MVNWQGRMINPLEAQRLSAQKASQQAYKQKWQENINKQQADMAAKKTADQKSYFEQMSSMFKPATPEPTAAVAPEPRQTGLGKQTNYEEPSNEDVDASVKYKKYYGPSPIGNSNVQNPQPRRQFPWSTPQPKPEKDWEAIEDFKTTIGMRGGKFQSININRALQYPDMIDQAFGGSLTITNLTPELKSSLEAQGFTVNVPDYLAGKNLGTVRFGSGSQAFQSYDKLKSLGSEIQVQPFTHASFDKVYNR